MKKYLYYGKKSIDEWLKSVDNVQHRLNVVTYIEVKSFNLKINLFMVKMQKKYETTTNKQTRYW